MAWTGVLQKRSQWDVQMGQSRWQTETRSAGSQRISPGSRQKQHCTGLVAIRDTADGSTGTDVAGD